MEKFWDAPVGASLACYFTIFLYSIQAPYTLIGGVVYRMVRGRAARTRTRKSGFGDRRDTISPQPHKKSQKSKFKTQKY